MAQYNYTNAKGTKYYLNSKQVQLKNGRENTIYFFSKDMRRETASDMPDGKVVKENDRTGLPFLKKAL